MPPRAPHFASKGRLPVVNTAAQVPQVIHHGIRGWGMTTKIWVKNASPLFGREGRLRQQVMMQVAQEHPNNHTHPMR